VSRIRRFVYWLGLRPSPGSVLYSPSIDAVLTLAKWAEAFELGYSRGIRMHNERR
jgi:hypothetical protein